MLQEEPAINIAPVAFRHSRQPLYYYNNDDDESSTAPEDSLICVSPAAAKLSKIIYKHEDLSQNLVRNINTWKTLLKSKDHYLEKKFYKVIRPVDKVKSEVAKKFNDLRSQEENCFLIRAYQFTKWFSTYCGNEFEANSYYKD